MTAADRLIVAFDDPDLAASLRLAKQLRGLIRYAKIGSALFTAAGPRAIERFRALGLEVFLDLKFHDIPSTVEKSCRQAARHGVFLLTVHASGGQAMLKAAAAGVRSGTRHRRPRVVGVTVLTSVSTASAVALAHRAVALAQDAKQAGLDGVVASAQEAAAIRRRLGRPFLIVCPGIRPASADHADHSRVATPAAAIASGADLLVVGRPIAEAHDPRAAVTRILEDITHGVCCTC